MEAAVVAHAGRPKDVINLRRDFPKPSLEDAAPTAMLVRVQACSLSAPDTMLLSGRLGLFFDPNAEYVLGADVCGVVEEVGWRCTRFKVGDVVMGDVKHFARDGGACRFAVLEQDHAVLKPEALSAVEAAALPTSGTAAMDAVEKGHVGAGSRVLVLGGASGIGSLAVQLAKDAGASHVATTSRNADLLLSLGADKVIDYTTHNWWDEVSDLDVIIDCVGDRKTWPHLRNAFRDRREGRYVTCNPLGFDVSLRNKREACRLFMSTMCTMMRLSCKSNGKGPDAEMVDLEKRHEHLRDVADLAAAQRIRPVLDEATPVPWDEGLVREAMVRLGQQRAEGKIVIDLDLQVVPQAKLIFNEEPQK